MAINLPEPKAAAVVQMMRSVDVFEVEIMCELKEWESVLQVIEVSTEHCRRRELIFNPGRSDTAPPSKAR